MSICVANEIRTVGVQYCSACRCQDPEASYVDFDAACDRGYGDELSVSMDDLVLCATCLRTGAVLVGMVDGVELEERARSLETRLESERKRADQAASYADRMEEALAKRPAPVKVSRPRGRPKKGN